MFFCPKCKIPLKTSSNPFGIFWYCPTCTGRAVSLHVLRKVIPQNIINKLWQRAKSGEYKSYRQCPICEKDLPEIPIINDDKTVRLDVCTKCCFIWFDGSEYESLPKVEFPESKEEEKLSLEARKALALCKIESMKRIRDFAGVTDGDPPEFTYQKLITLLGFPVEGNVSPMKNNPIVTWIIGIAMVIVTLLSLSNLQHAVNTYGLVPAEFTRDFGFTFVSSFFLHAGILHLVSNLYFLLIFGDNVEDVLGKKKYILLIISAALAGDILQIVLDPQKSIPSIGASGGISGILTYYCLRFPNARLSMFYFIYIRFGWLSINVRTFIAFWIFFQVLMAFEQTAGISDVSGFAHLGGAGIGFLFWAAEVMMLSKSTVTNAEEFQFDQDNDE
jgi:membrane associated rhomboid family serine protease/Zn-finger nucleic acid-binding protein